MSDNSGWVKVYRRLLGHPIWTNSTPEQKVILVTLLCMANHEPKKWEWNGTEFEVGRGQFITSLESIKSLCGKGVTTQKVRTALQRFKKLNFLTYESTKTGRLVTIVNYDKWQGDGDETNIDANKDLTKTQQRPNKDLTTNKNYKNYKNDKEVSQFPAKISQFVISYLNERTGCNYYVTESVVKKIGAILNSGHTQDEIITVIDKKCAEWMDSDKMRPYLKPSTLFGNKFDEYLAAPDPEKLVEERERTKELNRLKLERSDEILKLRIVKEDILKATDSDERKRLADSRLVLENNIENLDRRIERLKV